MISWKRAVLLGLLSWLLPLIVSMALFPLKQANASLFDSAMTLVVLLTAGLLLPVYFRGREPPVEVKELPPTRILFLRHAGPYDQVGATWGRLMAWAGPPGLVGPGTRMIGVSYDDPDVTPPDKLRYDAAITIEGPVQPEGEFGVQELPGGKYAVVMHRRPYERLGETYQRLFGGWLPKSGFALPNSPAYEEYLNSPQSTTPEDLVTVIRVPLE